MSVEKLNFKEKEIASMYSIPLKTLRNCRKQQKFGKDICFTAPNSHIVLYNKEKFEKWFEEIKQNQAPKLLSQNRTHWKCQRLCHFYKNNWPGTDQNMCIHIEKKLKEHGMQETINTCTRPGFNIGFYEAPG